MVEFSWGAERERREGTATAGKVKTEGLQRIGTGNHMLKNSSTAA